LDTCRGEALLPVEACIGKALIFLPLRFWTCAARKHTTEGHLMGFSRVLTDTHRAYISKHALSLVLIPKLSHFTLLFFEVLQDIFAFSESFKTSVLAKTQLPHLRLAHLRALLPLEVYFS